MRDPKRIDLILEALRAAWLQAPDERLGQFLDNCAFGKICGGGVESYRGNMRFLEDDKWLEAINSRFSGKATGK